MRIAAIGAFTPVGADARASAAAVRAGLSGFREHDFMVDTAGEPMRVAQVHALPTQVEGRERLQALLRPAVAQLLPVLRTLGADPSVGVALALPPRRPGGVDAAGIGLRAVIAELLGSSAGPFHVFECGHAGGYLALEQAGRWLREGAVEAAIVAGVDSYLAPETLEWLEHEDQFHGAGPMNNAWGFIPGEAAGALLLTRVPVGDAAANQAGETNVGQGGWADVLSVGLGRETRLNKTGAVCIGEGLTQALRSALAPLPAGQRVHNIVCDMNGEAYRADEYGFSGLRVRDRLIDATDFLAPADCWGDVGAASVPLHLLLAASACRKGHARGPLSLVWGSSDSGERGAAVIRADVKERV